MSGLSYGLGSFGFITLDGAPSAYFPEHASAVLEVTADEEIINAYINGSADGVLRAFKVFEEAAEFSFSIEAVGFNFDQLGMLVGEQISLTPNYTKPASRAAIVERTGTSPNFVYKIENDELIGQEPADVRVKAAARGVWGEVQTLTVVSDTPANATEVELDATAGELIFFDDTWENAPINYVFQETRTNVRTIGVNPSPTRLRNFGFQGLLKTDEYGANEGISITIPSMTRSRAFSLNSAERERTIEFTPVQAAGQPSVVQFAEIIDEPDD